MDESIPDISPSYIKDENQTEGFSLPAKPEIPAAQNNLWLRSFISLALYIIIGYYFFNHNWLLLLILTAVVLFHEMGHFVAMKYFGYADLGIFFIPLLGAYVSGSKQQVSQKQSAVIFLAGPLPGILLGVLFHFIADANQYFFLEKISWILIFLNLLNLLPIYPLDGGQLLNKVFLNDNDRIGKIFFLVSTGLMVWFAISINFLPLLLFPAYMLYKMWGNWNFEKIITKIEAEGINLETTYDAISDADYWIIRKALIKHHPDLQDIPSAPEFVIDEQEDKIVGVMQSILQQTLIMDAGLLNKIIILIIWIACFLSPLMLNLPVRLF